MNKLMYTYEADAEILHNGTDKFLHQEKIGVKLHYRKKDALIMGNMFISFC